MTVPEYLHYVGPRPHNWRQTGTVINGGSE